MWIQMRSQHTPGEVHFIHRYLGYSSFYGCYTEQSSIFPAHLSAFFSAEILIGPIELYNSYFQASNRVLLECLLADIHLSWGSEVSCQSGYESFNIVLYS